LGTGGDHKRIVVENFGIHMLLGYRREDSHNHQLDFALLQSAICHRRFGSQEMNGDARILPGKPIDDRGSKAGGNDDGSPNPYFASLGVGEELDMFYSLPQLIEGNEAAIEKGAPINRGLYALRTAIQETDPERVFHVGNRLRYCRLRHRELSGCLSHAAASSHGQQDIQIPQFEMTAEALGVPLHRFPHQ
jgi:hypothetical protein